MSTSSIDQEAASSFWNWALENESGICQIKSGDDPIYLEGVNQLSKVNEGLRLEIAEDEIVISADGDRSLFGVVKFLCELSPSFHAIKVTAFRQPRELHALSIGEITLDPNEIYFLHDVEDSKIDLLIMHKAIRFQDDTMLAAPLLTMLDHAIGEETVESKIGGINFWPVTEFPDKRPLTKLKEVIDNIQV